MSYRKHKVLFLVMFLISTGVLLLPLFFKDYLREISSLGLIGIFIINFFSSATVFIPAPGIISVAVGAEIYNPLAVALISSVGSALGEGVSFVLGHSSRHILQQKKKSIPLFLTGITFKRYGTLILLVSAVIPNPLIDGFGILAGATFYPLKKFLVIIFIGRLIRNVIIVNLY